MDAAHFVSSRTALCLRHAGFHAFDCKSYYDNKDFLRLFPRRGEVTGGWYEAAPIAEAIDWLQVKYDVIIDVTWEGIERGWLYVIHSPKGTYEATIHYCTRYLALDAAIYDVIVVKGVHTLR